MVNNVDEIAIKYAENGQNKRAKSPFVYSSDDGFGFTPCICGTTLTRCSGHWI